MQNTTISKNIARRAHSLGISLVPLVDSVLAEWEGESLERATAKEALAAMATYRENAIEANAAEAEHDEPEADAPEADEEEKPTRSVVAEHYRREYAARGHADHCGDWLATELVGLCKTPAGFDMAFFQAIEAANGIANKCKLEKPSDIGRYRMTGRNLLTKVVVAQRGLKMPEHFQDGAFYDAPTEWLDEQAAKKAARRKA